MNSVWRLINLEVWWRKELVLRKWTLELIQGEQAVIDKAFLLTGLNAMDVYESYLEKTIETYQDTARHEVKRVPSLLRGVHKLRVIAPEIVLCAVCHVSGVPVDRDASLYHLSNCRGVNLNRRIRELEVKKNEKAARKV